MLQKMTAMLVLVFVGSIGLAQEEDPKEPAGGNVASQAAEYRALLAQPPEKLAELGRDRAIKLLADLKYGQAIARGEAREKNLEHLRVELMARFDETKKAYLDLRDQVEAEMEKIRQQFGDNPAECDRQLMTLIAKHRPKALILKAEANRCDELAQATDERLGAVRQQLVGVRGEWDLVAQGHRFNRPAMPHSLVQLGLGTETLASFGLDEQTLKELNLDSTSLDLEGLGPETDIDGGIPVRPVSSESVDKAVQELRELF